MKRDAYLITNNLREYINPATHARMRNTFDTVITSAIAALPAANLSNIFTSRYERAREMCSRRFASRSLEYNYRQDKSDSIFYIDL